LECVQQHFAERLSSFELVSAFALDLSSTHIQTAKPIDARQHRQHHAQRPIDRVFAGSGF
jgi:hypothetical protein